MVLNYHLQCLQQLLLDIGVFQFIQYCPSSSPICSSGGENGFEKSPWGLDKLPPSLSLIFCARSLPLSLSLCGRWLFISQSTRSRLKQMLITIVSPLSLFLYSFPFGYEAVDSIFLEGTFFCTPHEHINAISWPRGRCVFALIYNISSSDCEMCRYTFVWTIQMT